MLYAGVRSNPHFSKNCPGAIVITGVFFRCTRLRWSSSIWAATTLF